MLSRVDVYCALPLKYMHSRREFLKLSLQAKFPMKISRFQGSHFFHLSFSLFFFLLIYFLILISRKFIPYFKHFKMDHMNSSGMVMKDSTKSNLNVDKVNPRRNLIICSANIFGTIRRMNRNRIY